MHNGNGKYDALGVRPMVKKCQRGNLSANWDKTRAAPESIDAHQIDLLEESLLKRFSLKSMMIGRTSNKKSSLGISNQSSSGNSESVGHIKAEVNCLEL